MEDIKKFLLKDEEILWSRFKSVNLLGFINTGIILIIALILFSSVLLIIFIFQLFILGIIITLTLTIIGIVGTFFIINKNKEERKKILGLSSEQLKNYEFFEILTNKRYIRKNFYLNYYDNFSVYPMEFLEINDYILFLNLNFIKEIVVDSFYKKIFFSIRFNSSKFASDIFIEYSEDEFDEVIEILKKILNLEKKEQDTERIVYIRKN